MELPRNVIGGNVHFTGFVLLDQKIIYGATVVP